MTEHYFFHYGPHLPKCGDRSSGQASFPLCFVKGVGKKWCQHMSGPHSLFQNGKWHYNTQEISKISQLLYWVAIYITVVDSSIDRLFEVSFQKINQVSHCVACVVLQSFHFYLKILFSKDFSFIFIIRSSCLCHWSNFVSKLCFIYGCSFISSLFWTTRLSC